MSLITNIFNKIDELKGGGINHIIFESYEPLIFTYAVRNNEYLFICPKHTNNEIIWIGNLVDNSIILKMLTNKITVRDAILNDTYDKNKIIIKYEANKQDVSLKIVSIADIQDYLLPTKGEYLDAEDEEYDDIKQTMYLHGAKVGKRL